MALLFVQDRGDRVGHRAQVHRDVLGLHHQLAARLEQCRRAVAALLDVRRVGGADQDGTHLVAYGAKPPDLHAEGDRIQAH